MKTRTIRIKAEVDDKVAARVGRWGPDKSAVIEEALERADQAIANVLAAEADRLQRIEASLIRVEVKLEEKQVVPPTFDAK